jgi:hypothetical protein
VAIPNREIIDLKPASNGFMCMSIGALLDLFFCEHQMNRLANGVRFNNCGGRDVYLPPVTTVPRRIIPRPASKGCCAIAGVSAKKHTREQNNNRKAFNFCLKISALVSFITISLLIC